MMANIPDPYSISDQNQNAGQPAYMPNDPYNNNTNCVYPPASSYTNPINPYPNQNNQYGNNGSYQYYDPAPNQGTFPGPVASPIQPQPGMPPGNGYVNNTNAPPQYSNVYYETPGKYDPYNINYQQVSIDQWHQIPCQESEYSQYWDSPESFTPSNYSENTEKETSCNDLCWTIFFWLNFAATIALLIYLIVTKKTGKTSISFKIVGIKGSDIGICAAIGLALGIVSNIIHFIFIACCSKFYLGCGMAIGLIYAIISAVLIMISGNGFVGFLLPAVYLVILAIYYCCACKYINFSSAILKTSAKLVLMYPGLICFCLLQIIWSLIVNAMFCILIYYVQKRGIHEAVYLYVVFSYLWSMLTFEYVEYLTVSGVASTWYFLYDTDYYPNSPVCQSYKRAMGTSFGSAAFAGFVLAVIQFLEMIIESSDSSSSDNGFLSIICCLLKCIAMCVLCILESCVSLLNRFALVYCAAFGIPYIAACKRFVELECTRFIRVFMSHSIISNATTYNLLVYSIASALCGYGFGHLIFKSKNDYSSDTKFMFKIFCCCFALLFTFGIYEMVVEPILTISDTIMICFSEHPDNLNNVDSELYETIRETYDTEINRKVSGNNPDDDSR